MEELKTFVSQETPETPEEGTPETPEEGAEGGEETSE